MHVICSSSRIVFFSCRKAKSLSLSDVSPSRGYPEAGMSFGDSKAVFKQRAMAMGMEEAVFRAFDRDGINTMATFAFACVPVPMHRWSKS